MTNNEMCQGCFSKMSYRWMTYCSQLSIEHRDQCPCVICLVKSMCNITCEDYSKFVHNRKGDI